MARGFKPSNNNNTETITEIVDMSLINNIDDIRLIITNSKLTLPLSKLIFNSSFKDEFTVLFLVLLNTVDLHSNTKVNFLTAAFDLKLYNLAKGCLDTNKFTFVEILKCLKIMDSKRNIRILNEKLVEIKSKYQQRKSKLQESANQYRDKQLEAKLQALSISDEPEEIKQKKINEFNEKLESQKKIEQLYKEKLEKYNNDKLLKDTTTTATVVTPAKEVDKKKDKKKKSSTKKSKETTATTDETTTTTSTDENESTKSIKEKRKLNNQRELLFKRRYEHSIQVIETKIRELTSYGYESTLSGNVVKMFRAFFKQVPRSVLEYFASGQPKATWKSIADLLHLSPKDLCEETPWFLSVMFGKAAPENTHVYQFEKELKTPESFTKERAIQLINQFKPSYAFIRKSLPTTLSHDKDIKQLVAQYEDIDVLIWWLHELNSVPEILTLVIKRIESGESLDKVSVGTLLEKAMLLKETDPLFQVLFKSIVEKMNALQQHFVLPPPISIFGDKSGSMEVAVRLSNIISFVIGSLTPDSALSFFDTKDVPSPLPVNSLDNLFKLRDLVKAGGGTDPGASMVKLLENKIVKNYICVVTDEEENAYQHGRFSDLFIKYRDQVNKDCKLVFVSFLALHSKGQMVTELRSKGVEPIQILFDRSQPDVSKIDGMLSSLSCESELFKDQLDLFVNIMNTVGDKQLYQLIKEKKSRLMSFSLNIELGIENLKSLISKYQSQPKSSNANMELLLIKNGLNRLIKISQDTSNQQAEQEFTKIQKNFVKLSKDEGIKFLFDSISNLDRSIYIAKYELENEIKQQKFVTQSSVKSVVVPEGRGDGDASIANTKSSILNGDLSIQDVSNQLTSDNKSNFVSIYSVLLDQIELPSKFKINVLCGAFQSKNYEFAKFILYNPRYTFKEVSKTIKILDSQRKIRQIQLKLDNALKSHENRRIKLDEQSKLYFEKKKLEELALNDGKKDITKTINNNNYTPPSTSTTTSIKRKQQFKKRNNGAVGKSKKNDKLLKKESIKIIGKNGKSKVNEKLIEKRFESSVKKMNLEIEQLQKYQYKGSLSGNLVVIFKNWFKIFSEKKLEYFALIKTKENFREMADLLHLSPKDFQCSWFLECVFGKIPKGTVVEAFSDFELINQSSLEFTDKEKAESLDYLTEQILIFKPSYSYIRKKIDPTNLPDSLKLIIARYEDLNTVLWWYSELCSYDVDCLLSSRLHKETFLNQSNGVLLEKAMYLQQNGIPIFKDILPLISDNLKLLSSKISLPPPLATLGDASASMDVAIRIATIVASLITRVTPNSTLKFFNHAPIFAPLNTNELSEVFKVSDLISGNGATSPAAGLYPFYEKKQILEYLVVVSDEAENSNYRGYNFAQLFKKYLDEVSPNCKLVFISFLDSLEQGQMVKQLNEEYSIFPLQFKLDKNRPDLKKVDEMFTTLSCESNEFNHQIKSLNLIIENFGFLQFKNYLNDPINNGKLFFNDFTISTLSFILNKISTSNPPSNNQKSIESVYNQLLESSSLLQFDSLHKQLTSLLLDNNLNFNQQLLINFNNLIFNNLNNYLIKQSPLAAENINNTNNNNSKTITTSATTTTTINNSVSNQKKAKKVVFLDNLQVSILFTYLVDSESLVACSRVCKLWRKCSLNSNIWTMFMNRESKSLDLVFCIDYTASMSAEINQVKIKMNSIVDRIQESKVDVKVAMVFYNDHENIYLKTDPSPTIVHGFTNNLELVKSNIGKIVVNGGNDNSEAVADGLYEVSKLKFRPTATKICILISDAPGHGYDDCLSQGNADNFPKGCPCGHDCIELVKQLTRRGITFYTVSCRPTPNSSDFLSAIADLSEGKCFNLTSVDYLSDFIVGSAQDSIYQDSITQIVISEVQQVIAAYPELQIDECIYKATYQLRSKGVLMKDSTKSMNSLIEPTIKYSKYSLMLQSDSDKQFLEKYSQYKFNLLSSNQLATVEQQIVKSFNTTSKKQQKQQKDETKNSTTTNNLILINIPYVRKICKKQNLIN